MNAVLKPAFRKSLKKPEVGCHFQIYKKTQTNKNYRKIHNFTIFHSLNLYYYNHINL